MTILADRLRRSLVDFPHEGGAPIATDEALLPDSFRPASVLIPIIDAARPEVLLTVRRADLRQHAGQVAFPGGRIDPEDDGPVAAALREAHEEVGLDPAAVELVGIARPYRTYSGFEIIPVVGVIPEGLPLAPQESEVDLLFRVPLDILFSRAHHLVRIEPFDGIDRRYYEIDWPEHRIWGVTAGIIVDLAPRLAGLMAASA